MSLQLLLLAIMVLLNVPAIAADSDRYVGQFKLPTGQIVMVDEGENEPRSIGSYSVRIYSGAMAEYPFDDFVTGIILPRDGVVEKVLLEDLDGDNLSEIIVTQRSVGSGSYLALDAVQFKDKLIKVLISIKGLDPYSDPVTKLKEKLQEPSK